MSPNEGNALINYTVGCKDDQTDREGILLSINRAPKFDIKRLSKTPLE
jgi:hypothetical protein